MVRFALTQPPAFIFGKFTPQMLKNINHTNNPKFNSLRDRLANKVAYSLRQNVK